MVPGHNDLWRQPGVPKRRWRSEVLRRYREWIGSLPFGFTTSVALMNLPPLPMVPGISARQIGNHGAVAHGGTWRPAELLQPWLDWRRSPGQSSTRCHSATWPKSAMILHDPVPGHTTGAWLRDLSDSVLDTLVEYGVSNNGSSPPGIDGGPTCSRRYGVR